VKSCSNDKHPALDATPAHALKAWLRLSILDHLGVNFGRRSGIIGQVRLAFVRVDRGCDLLALLSIGDL
jgi:hypothetical protein